MATVWFLARTPADPDLLTLRARDVLDRADVVFRGKTTVDRIIRAALAGRRVVRVGGTVEEAEAVRNAKIEIELIPSVSPELAAAWRAGYFAEDAFEVGRTQVRELASLTPTDAPVALVERAGSPRQSVTIGRAVDVARRAMDAEPPLVLVPGERKRVPWFELRPLYGKRIVVTRARAQAESLIRRLKDLGAEVIEVPTIEIRPVPRVKIVDADVVLFTSQNGVDLYFRRMRDLGRDSRRLAKALVAAVGPATASALERHGVLADFIASEFTSERLARELGPLVRGKTVLHAGADKTNPEVPRILGKFGAKYVKATLYRIVPAKKVKVDGADLVTLASAETARQFSNRKIPAACIGPVTAKSARAAGFRVVAVAKEYTIDGLIEAILRWAK